MSTPNGGIRARLAGLGYSRPDTLAYLATFLLGLGYFLIAKEVGLAQWLQSAGLVALMVGYSALVTLLPRIRFRLDQAGDNVYYLGFLFTLVSMAYALAQFSTLAAHSGEGTELVITNFGIALTTTIVGIFLRVLMHQMRVDPADFESMTRIELTEAAGRVRAAMENATLDFAQLQAEAAQRGRDLLADMQAESTRVVAAFAEQLLAANQQGLEAMRASQIGFSQISAELSTTLREFVEASIQASHRLAAVEPPPRRIADGLDRVTASLAGLDERLGALLADVEAARTANQNAIGGIRDAVAEIGEASRAISTAGTQLLETRVDSERTLARHATGLATRLRAVSAAAMANKRALDETTMAARDAFAQLTALLEASNDTVHSLKTLTEQLTDNVRTATDLLRDDGARR